MKAIIIPSGQSGKRVDRFLKKEVFYNEEISRAEISREVKDGKILVNGKKVRPSHILKENEEITLPFLHPSPEGREGLLMPNPKIRIKIIEDNKNLLVIDKPAGIQVHPVKYPPRRIAASPLFHRVNPDAQNSTVVNWLLAKYPEIKNVHDPSTSSGQVKSREAELRPGIVHRLDKDTSGLMVIAKNQKTFDALKKLFQSRKIKKTYLAVVHGILKEKTGTIEAPIAKAANYKKQTIASARTKTKVRTAFTGYRVVKEFSKHSLVEAYLKTGRTHQIRIHLWSIGHPLVGDRLYKRKGHREDTALRQLLHAEKLAFRLGGKEYNFRSPMPRDIKDFIRKR